MRVLITIPHYFATDARTAAYGRQHGSLGGDPSPRRAALADCVASLHRLYGPAQRIIDYESRVAHAANAATAGQVDVVVCTTAGHHLLDALDLPAGAYEHQPTASEPPLLGYECHAVLRDRLGSYDWYGYLEDDLIARDPWFFRKLDWFTAEGGPEALLLPNRYEVGPLGLVHKAYVDGDLPVGFTAPYQSLAEIPEAVARLLGTKVIFRRPRNPHAGCFFLRAGQMNQWARQPYFLDRATDFVGPLESAATLGVMRTFRIYKPAPENASFLEIEHHGTAYLDRLRRRDDPAASEPGFS